MCYTQHKDSTTTPEDEAFELLMSHMVLQLFTEPKQATEILEVGLFISSYVIL